jgi:hypothetical protein
MLGFWHLVVLSAIPVLKICFMCSVGTLLARQVGAATNNTTQQQQQQPQLQ